MRVRGAITEILSPELRDRCRKLRCDQTNAEALLWRILRNRGLMGYKFRRQHSIGPYILDFYCHEAALAVELDGGHHAEQVKQDTERTRMIEDQGVKVVRYWNNDVLGNLEGALADLLGRLRERDPHPDPLPREARSPHPSPLPKVEGAIKPRLQGEVGRRPGEGASAVKEAKLLEKGKTKQKKRKDK